MVVYIMGGGVINARTRRSIETDSVQTHTRYSLVSRIPSEQKRVFKKYIYVADFPKNITRDSKNKNFWKK